MLNKTLHPSLLRLPDRLQMAAFGVFHFRDFMIATPLNRFGDIGDVHQMAVQLVWYLVW